MTNHYISDDDNSFQLLAHEEPKSADQYMTSDDDGSFQLFAGDEVQEGSESGDQCIDSDDDGNFQLFAAADGMEELESVDQCVTSSLFDGYIPIVTLLVVFFYLMAMKCNQCDNRR